MIEGHQDIWDQFAARSPLPWMPVVNYAGQKFGGAF